MPTFPTAQLLISAAPSAPPDDFTVVRSTLTAGLPHLVDLTNVLRLKFTLPTGLMHPWLTAEPTAVVSTSTDGQLPQPTSQTGNPVLRMTVIHGGVPLATVPVTVGVPRSHPDAGEADRGVALEVLVTGWMIVAGSVQGPGDFGSYIDFAWRPAALAVSDFGPPVIVPSLQRRMIPRLKFQSQLGLRKLVIDPRFAVRRWPFDVRP